MTNLIKELEKKAISISNPARKIVLLSIVKNEISSAREKLTKFFDECGYLSHEQRYKVSCKIDEVLGEKQ